MSQRPNSEKLIWRLIKNRLAGYVAAVIGIAAVTLVLEPVHLHVSATTVALSLLIVVLGVATLWGSRPAAFASVIGVLCFNFYFLPPIGTWSIADPENWFALIAFLVTAMIAGQLSAHAKKRAEVAESRRLEIERLYRELSQAFEKASHAEALRQSEQLKSALLDAVTHDIRTPLTSIKASVTTLLDEYEGNSEDLAPLVLDEESRREMLYVINEESDRLNRFVEDLIELARIEAGDVRLRRQYSRVKDIVSAALTRSKTLTCNHLVEVNIQKDLPLAHVDSQAISEVIYTLVDNAAKYSPSGTTIRISAEQNGNSRLVVAVEDEGRGIPSELREQVFEKFFRAIHDTRPDALQPTGSGMGLAIARGIIEAHDGNIWVSDAKSNTGGARFEFTVPVDNE